MKINSLLTYIFLILFLASGCAKKEITNSASRGENIICFGDSITYGYGVARGEDYPTVLSTLLKRPVINAGIDGDTSVDALKRLQKDVLDRNPYLVIVEFAGNDFLRQIPLSETEANIRSIIKTIQDKGAMVALVDISAGMFLAEYRDAYSRIARQTNSIFVPSVLKGIITNPSMKSDFLHPSRQGYRTIAKRIYKTVTSKIHFFPSVSAAK